MLNTNIPNSANKDLQHKKRSNLQYQVADNSHKTAFSGRLVAD